MIDVTQFGAVPNDGEDDYFALQKAIEASKPGDTIQFPSGEFDLSRSLDPKGAGRRFVGTTQICWDGKTYSISSETMLKAPETEFAFRFAGSDVGFAHLSFLGRGFATADGGEGMIRKLVIDTCHFILHARGENENAIQFTNGLADSSITNCIFDPIDGDNGIYGYNWNHVTIANNLFLNGNEGIHLTAFEDKSEALLIEQNYFARLRRMGVEIQGGGHSTTVQDNFYELPEFSQKSDENRDTFAYSIVSDRSVGTRVRRNTSLAPQRPDGLGVRIVFELGGQDVRCEDNYSVGGNAILGGTGTKATGLASGNQIIDPLIQSRNANEATIEYSNNGPDVKLTWDINRVRPGPGKRY